MSQPNAKPSESVAPKSKPFVQGNRPKETKKEIERAFKVIVRKLPTRDFTEVEFAAAVANICKQFDVPPEQIIDANFFQGKMSRKRGPVTGVGYLTVSDETFLKTFLSKCPRVFPFINDLNGTELQPEIKLSSYTRLYRKSKPDPLAGTIESDPDYIKFCEEVCDVAVPKRPSAEVQLDLLMQQAGKSKASVGSKVDVLQLNMNRIQQNAGSSSTGASNSAVSTSRDKEQEVLPGYIALTQRNDPKQSALLLYMKQLGSRKHGGSKPNPRGSSSSSAAVGGTAEERRSSRRSKKEERDKSIGGDGRPPHKGKERKERVKDREKGKEKGKAKYTVDTAVAVAGQGGGDVSAGSSSRSNDVRTQPLSKHAAGSSIGSSRPQQQADTSGKGATAGLVPGPPKIKLMKRESNSTPSPVPSSGFSSFTPSSTYTAHAVIPPSQSQLNSNAKAFASASDAVYTGSNSGSGSSKMNQLW